MLFQFTRFAFCALSVVSATAASVEAQAFDTGPLRSPAAFPANGLPTNAAAFTRWLKAQASTLPEEGVVAAREQLFAILSADAKRRVRAGSAPLSQRQDSSVAELFEWGHRLGLPGARLVALRLGYSPAVTDPSAIETPGFTIEFDSLYTLMAEADGWMVRFPHYFMIGAASRQRLNDGNETSMVVLSTLFAKDSTARPGASQATIMLVSARAPAPELTAFWLGQLGISPRDTIPKLSPNSARTYRARDAAARLTKELVVFAPSGRAILAAYIGLDGTFETNHPHFIDLLTTLRLRPRP